MISQKGGIYGEKEGAIPKPAGRRRVNLGCAAPGLKLQFRPGLWSLQSVGRGRAKARAAAEAPAPAPTAVWAADSQASFCYQRWRYVEKRGIWIGYRSEVMSSSVRLLRWTGRTWRHREVVEQVALPAKNGACSNWSKSTLGGKLSSHA